MFQAKILSSLEKCFLDEPFDGKPALDCASMLLGERYSFCAAIAMDGVYEKKTVRWCAATSDMAANITVSKVGHVPVEVAAFANHGDDNYLRKTPGLYPDLLTPMTPIDRLYLKPGYVQTVWVTVETTGRTKAGSYTVELIFTDDENSEMGRACLPLTVIGAQLPLQRTTVTHWFHCDCLAQYYNVPVFGDRHFEIIEAFIQKAVSRGVNMILTPVFTPPLDTAVGGERLTTQLVGVRKDGDSYAFDFTLLDRWINICERQGVRVYEISHLFTQWGAEHAPKVMAEVNGLVQRIFGWETAAHGEEYTGFLRQFLPALTRHLDSRGIAKERVAFHISDEPSAKHLESYRQAKEIVAPLVEGYDIFDALSDYAFYQQGLVARPIPSNDHIEPFIEGNVPNLWTYYCLAQHTDVSNRFMSMPSARNRILGAQMYKYNIEGFLHWGYNFYNAQYSVYPIDPYRVTDGAYFGPSGDAFVVYPAADGTAHTSIRFEVFHEALQDIRAFALCEQLYSRDFVLALIDAHGPVTFRRYPQDAAYILDLRRKVNEAIALKACNT